MIAILVALLLPAVQAAREANRQITCSNNLKQLGLAMLHHEQARGHFPTGGWGWGWLGDPKRGVDIRQSGGWLFNVLPYLEQQTLHDLQKGKTNSTALRKTAAAAQMIGTPLSVAQCPTRRHAIVYPHWGFQFHYADDVQRVAKSDYGANGGDSISHPGVLGIWSQHCGNADCGPSAVPSDETLHQKAQQAENYGSTGIIHPLSLVCAVHVSDGLSNNYLIGEKYLNPDHYLTGHDSGDNETTYIGDNQDITRRGGPAFPPRQDRPGLGLDLSFGSAHATAFGMCFCDGSVRRIVYAIDRNVHRWLANRQDGNSVGDSEF